MAPMTRKRLSRQDSRDRTAQRLLDAAEKLIARRGLDATSVEDIAEAAGYSRGAFYSNFKSKSDLFFELLRRDQQRMRAQFGAVLDDELTLDEVQTRIQEIYGSLYHDSDRFMTWAEARMRSARDRRFRARLNALMVEKRNHVVKLIKYFYKHTGVTPASPLEPLAMGFMSLMEGVRLFGVSCPNDMSPEVAESVLKLFVNSAMQQVRQPSDVGSKA